MNKLDRRAVRVAVLLTAVVLLAQSTVLGAGKKKKGGPEQPKKTWVDVLDYSKVVWPNPPAITRVKYLNYFTAEKPQEKQQQKKAGWMDRLAGVATGETGEKPRFQLVTPYGVAVDSKGRLYVADSKVLAIFIFDTETKDVQMIKNGTDAKFGWITGLAIDDTDRLYVSDTKLRHVLVLDPQHHAEASISEGMRDPGGLAIDVENRFLYVADAELDQVLVYDADPPYKLLRKIGVAGKAHSLSGSGEFSKPTNVAVDKDGNLYVSDTLNDRVQVFDAEGNFIRTWGKPGDGPGYFARPKGIAIDADGHVWVADTVQNRLQVFTPEGRLLLWIGGRGVLPGHFQALVDVTIDKNNRVFTSEQYGGRVQMFRYFTDDEAKAELAKREAEEKKKFAEKMPKRSETGETTTAAAGGKDTAAVKK